jgi:hypothetical protein
MTFDRSELLHRGDAENAEKRDYILLSDLRVSAVSFLRRARDYGEKSAG